MIQDTSSGIVISDSLRKLVGFSDDSLLTLIVVKMFGWHSLTMCVLLYVNYSLCISECITC